MPTPPVDMSARIGGRTVTPALPVVDGSRPGPTERTFDELLGAFSKENVPIESDEGIRRRERVLDRMGALCREWIRSVCVRLQLPRDAVDSAGGCMYTSGSYRLGVHEPGADIDTILVAPNVCTRENFFGSNYVPPGFDGDESELANLRDPDSLAERIKRHPDVTNFVPVEGAAVPILTFDWEGVNIDLLFARLNSSSVPPTLDIDNDAVLDGVDSATEKSLNGPRVTNLIAALASGTPERYRTFLAVVRCVRKWAKARGLYSNKMGYWGGVNINISVALVVQLYPNTCAASLLRKFFLVFKSWRWPNPVMLTKPHDADLGLPVWSAFQAGAARQVAPIITPAYPAMNSTLAVSRQTLQIMHEEFCRGHEIVDRLWKDHQKRGGRKLEGDEFDMASKTFGELFQPSNFFIAYPHYLSLCITGPTQSDAQSWMGYVESRLRKLVSDMLGKSLPLSKIQLWPKKFEACVADRTALLTVAQRRNCATYFVGFRVDRYRMRGDQLNVEQQMQKFRQFELSRFEPLIPGMDIYVRCFGVKSLPLGCFEMYEGGKVGAMKRRRQLRDADPRRQEAKRVARLAQLKARMAEMQRKKEEMATKDDGAPRKRKREGEEDSEGGDEGNDTTEPAEGGAKTKVEDKSTDAGGEVVQAEVEEEEHLLEDALDAIQTEALEGRRKTREEAEEDRKKLLAGELLEGAVADGDDEGGEGDGADDADYLDVGGYTGEGARLGNLLPKRAKAAPKSAAEAALTVAEEEALILKRAGYTLVSDDEVAAVGGNIVLPWRKPEWVSGRAAAGAPKKEDGGGSGCNDAAFGIRFRTKFDVVELDKDGFVIDKGDDDFEPSKGWTGRMPGFEFKLGERGLGYYRTGKKVVVPSNTAY
mmetsp:Transcript_57478/g.171484  ORF Transcript_57478/g.171484 Transcript_57478/m.171484 type:complete len:875 (-) Transcript_57478:148-2772(-)